MNTNKEIYDAVLAGLAAAQVNIESGAPFVLTPNDMKVIDFEQYLQNPNRIRKDISFVDVQGFTAYFQDFKNGSTPYLFAVSDGRELQVRCIFDYDKPGEATSIQEPQWGSHRATMNLTYHPDFAELKVKSDVWHKQEDFALFVEENTHLFKIPAGADMLEIAQTLKGTQSATWKAGSRLANGERAFEYVEEIAGKGIRNDLAIPEYFLFSTPIFEGFEAQDIQAAFRWRLSEGKITFSYRLLSKQQERAAIESVKADITKKTGLPIFNVSNFDGLRFDVK